MTLIKQISINCGDFQLKYLLYHQEELHIMVIEFYHIKHYKNQNILWLDYEIIKIIFILLEIFI
jgi:hypothetical protein